MQNVPNGACSHITALHVVEQYSACVALARTSHLHHLMRDVSAELLVSEKFHLQTMLTSGTP